VKAASTTRFLAKIACAAAVALIVILPGTLYAQNGDDYDRGLTGDPLVDSILRAPGPDFLGGERSRRSQDIWDRDRPSSAPVRRDQPERDNRPPRPDAEDDWRQDRTSRDPQDTPQDVTPQNIEPEPRRAERTPPPPPVKRGDGPLDIVIRDVEPQFTPGLEQNEPEDRDQPKAGPGDADVVETEQAEAAGEPEPEPRGAAPTPPGDAQQTQQAAQTRPSDAAPPDDNAADSAATAEEPYREAPGQTPSLPQRDVATAAPGTTASAPAVPARAPEREDSSADLEKMIGQMLLIGFDGVKPSDAGVQRVVEQLEAGKAGGVIFMSRNIQSPQQVRSLTNLFANAARGHPTPLIAVDQEGGYVQRLSRSKGFNTYPSAERLGARNDPQGAYSAYRKLALELREYGFNVNLGPVLDLNINPSNPIIGRLKRSYGSDPEHVTAFAKAFVYAHNESGVLTVAKHFPGHGSSQTDSHDELVDISGSWSESELRPYRKLIESDAIDMVMTGHLYHPSFTEQQDVPVSLSQKGIQTVLRQSLNFDGVVISDDLDMRGVRQNRSFEDAIVGAAAAGNDILLITNSDGYKPDLPYRAAAAIRAGLDHGRIDIQRIRTAYQRILKLKEELSRLQRTATGRGEDRGLAAHSGG